MLAAEPDLFVFLGDNVYGDTRDSRCCCGQVPAARRASRGSSRSAAARRSSPSGTTTTIGENDAGGDYPMKEASRRIFCDFWGEPADSPRRTRDGIYAASCFGATGAALQLILPDLRFNRTPIRRSISAATHYEDWAKQQAGRRAAGARPLRARIPTAAATMLGEPQWRWLEAQLAQPGRSAHPRLEPAGGRRLPGLGGVDQLRRGSPAAVAGHPAPPRQRPDLHQRRHALRRAVAARRERALSALGPDLERPHRGLAGDAAELARASATSCGSRISA